MEQLLEIRTVPISYEFRINHAKIEMTNPNADAANVTRTKGGLNIHHTPARLKLDMVDMRASMGLKTTAVAVKEFGDNGVQAAYEAIGNIAMEGNALMDIHLNNDAFSEIAFQRANTSIDTMLGFMPSVRPKTDWEPHNLELKYEMDKLNFDWRLKRPQMDYVPAKIEYIVKEYPRLEIKYLGRPLYVPPSADPEHTPEPFDIIA